ncbi:MAG TPA: response regulator [Aggregatilineales bacterium]|nr:response regulator [Aggregatilineales bacterium]
MQQPILIVDDDNTNREFVADTLTRSGYQVIAVDNSYEAVSAVARFSPQLILLDIEMPILANLSFLQLYNRVPEPRAPVIAMTASDATVLRAVARCVRGYLDKPIARDALLKMVAKHASLAAQLAS